MDKALKMALVHDIPEIIAGDASPLGESGTGEDSHSFNEKNRRREISARMRSCAENFFFPLVKMVKNCTHYG